MVSTLYLSNQKIKGTSCASNDRPDLVISSNNDLVIIVECDEYQHSGYNTSCEHARMDRILDEFNSSRVVIYSLES